MAVAAPVTVRRYIDYPSRATLQATSSSSSSSGSDDGSLTVTAPLPLSPTSRRLRRAVRTCVCGVLYGMPLALAAPHTPLLSMTLTPHNRRLVVPRIMTHFFCVNAIAAGVAYGALVEPRLRAAPRVVRERRWLPQLGPLTALVPACSCLLASHLFYPGLGALLYEPTWQTRVVTFARMSCKCLCAYAPIHVPAALLCSTTIGSILWLTKARPQRSAAPEATTTS